MRRLPRFLLSSRRYLRTPKGRWLLNRYLKWHLRREARRMLMWRMIEAALREASKEIEREREGSGRVVSSTTKVRKTASRDII